MHTYQYESNGKLSWTLETFQEAAVKYRKDLLMLPLIGIEETLKYMTARPGIRYQERVGEMNGEAHFMPYNAGYIHNFNLELDYRTLETHFGKCITRFEPNTAISTILGTGATKGDGQMQTPTALLVLSLIAKSLSESLNNAIWNGKVKESSPEAGALFDGFDTITTEEITNNNISTSKGNYMELTEEITAANAVDVAKQILWSLDPRLRSQELYMYCSQDFVDKYNEGYLLTHGATPYNTQYGQQAVEGSNGKLIFVPLYNKADSNFIHVSPKSNMLVGYDQMSDYESVMVKEYEPFLLTYIATIFFGVQFESIDKRRLMVVKLADKTA